MAKAMAEPAQILVIGGMDSMSITVALKEFVEEVWLE